MEHPQIGLLRGINNHDKNQPHSFIINEIVTNQDFRNNKK